MTDRRDEFERELGRKLGRLAEGAPSGPRVEQIRGRLRRRRAYRTGGVCAGMMLIVVAGWLAMRMPGEGDVPGSGIVEKPSEPAAPVIAHQVEPLPVDSTSTEVEAALRPYCVAARAEVVMVSKRRGEPADVAMGGATLMSRDEDAAEIAMLFSNFDVAEVVMRGDVLMRASLGAMTH